MCRGWLEQRHISKTFTRKTYVSVIRHLKDEFPATDSQHGSVAGSRETMVGFRGRFIAKQYKPTGWGKRCFTLADSYVLNVLLDTGGDTNSQLPQSARVGMHLAEPYLHHLFTDRYDSSVPLHAANTDFTKSRRLTR